MSASNFNMIIYDPLCPYFDQLLISGQDIRELISEDEVMKGYNKPSPAVSTPAQKHTPYPNVLNPVEAPSASQASSAASSTTHDSQQQPRIYIHETPHRAPILTEPSQSHRPHLKTPFESFRHPSIHADCGSEITLDDYADLHIPSSGLEQTVFPGWIVTSFDEPNLWIELGLRNTSLGVH